MGERVSRHDHVHGFLRVEVLEDPQRTAVEMGCLAARLDRDECRSAPVEALPAATGEGRKPAAVELVQVVQAACGVVVRDDIEALELTA